MYCLEVSVNNKMVCLVGKEQAQSYHATVTCGNMGNMGTLPILSLRFGGRMGACHGSRVSSRICWAGLSAHERQAVHQRTTKEHEI